MRRIASILLVAAMAALPVLASSQQKSYSLDDLKADKTGAWDELRGHLTDVRPSQRGPQWNRIAEHACLRLPRDSENYNTYKPCADVLVAATASEPKNNDFALRVAMFLVKPIVFVAAGLANAPLCIKPGSGQNFRDCPDCPEMVVLPAGSFEMGAAENEPDALADEVPQHKVMIGAPFAIGQFSITVREYLSCVAAGACNPPAWQVKGNSNGQQYEQLGSALTGDDYPIVGVSWNGAKKYAQWLSAKTGKSYRLLTEAEFEYAARAGTTTPFWWGSSITPDQANYHGSSPPYAGGGKTGVDRQKITSNPWGLYQVHGNVWEWVEDCWHSSYDEEMSAPGDGSAWIRGVCKARVLRGGAWDSAPFALRSAFRNYYFPGSGTSSDGFRVARTLSP